MILRVGLTGGIASGKSTVARTLAGLGCVFTIKQPEELRASVVKLGRRLVRAGRRGGGPHG